MRRLNKFRAALACCFATGALLSFSALAWTDKPVRVLVPAPAGGTMDIVARLVAEQLSQDMGKPVIVDNKAGAGGAIAIQAMLQAPADGQTIMITASNVLVEIPHVMKTSFDPLKDVKPVATVASASMVLVGHPSLPAKTMKELVAYFKTNPPNSSFASYSAGTSSHYAGMILNQKAGLDLQHAPFQGSPPALTQLIGGHIPIMFDGMATSLPQITAGKLKAFAVASKTRSSHLPQVPTTAEEGFPEINFSNWIGVIVSSGVPSELVEKMAVAINKVAESSKVKGRLTSSGFEANVPRTPAALMQSVREDYDRNATIVKTFNIKLN